MATKKDKGQEEMKTIRLPRERDNPGPVFVSVNERSFWVPRGRPVTVPACVAEVLATSERLTMDADAYVEEKRTD